MKKNHFTSPSFKELLQENALQRLNRQQVATDAGMTVKHILNGAIMQPDTGAISAEPLFEDSGKVRDLARELTSHRTDGAHLKGNNVPNEINEITDKAGLTIARLTDAVVATKFHSKEQRSEMMQDLERIEQAVEKFNSKYNKAHIQTDEKNTQNFRLN